MVSEEFKEFIKTEKAKGKSDKEIYDYLKEKGWKDEILKQVFENVVDERIEKIQSKKSYKLYYFIGAIVVIALISMFFLFSDSSSNDEIDFFECGYCQFEIDGFCYNYDCCSNEDCVNDDYDFFECVEPSSRDAYCLYTKEIIVNESIKEITLNQNEIFKFNIEENSFELKFIDENKIEINEILFNVTLNKSDEIKIDENSSLKINFTDKSDTFTKISLIQVVETTTTTTTITTTTTTSTSTTTTTQKLDNCVGNPLSVTEFERHCVYERVDEEEFDQYCDYCYNETVARVYFCYNDEVDYMDLECEFNCSANVCNRN